MDRRNTHQPDRLAKSVYQESLMSVDLKKEQNLRSKETVPSEAGDAFKIYQVNDRSGTLPLVFIKLVMLTSLHRSFFTNDRSKMLPPRNATTRFIQGFYAIHLMKKLHQS